ncbi:YgeY family selenium metabolism-linked hydrolase [Tepidibacter aestuarii]|uniref:YgeY family selenium metabolism-linked hydrolase n=1 Tax=Tepidibacter aestuarii TaxID=2925782 RepID=UPI0020BEC692|nr:YgeY family selenium metabolism-linked hydrolase [Tepidibacter aestuarii]CAH2213745.1 putative succinyl-diaminopimelate desuccinylase [Tepidibacter aestuarii]
MKKQIIDIVEETRDDLLKFTQDLVRIKSYSGQEEKIVRIIEKKMRDLGYDEVIIDSMGNVVGKIGNGESAIMFDSHIDTVEVKDEEKWDVPPFSGKIVNDKLYGRGSVDMKSAAAASVYAGAIAKRLGLDTGKTIFVSCTVFEEDCDGENLKHMFKECNIKPDFFITCEPSGNKIVTGHKGKVQISIKTKGVSAHGSAPEKGNNAIYEMAEIIQRVEKTNNDLLKKDGPRRTLVMSQISSVSVSLNAVPSECEVYLDRRMVLGETEDTIKAEMDKIIEGKNASWEIGTIHRKSWAGMDIRYEPFHLAWEIDLEHKLSKACIDSYSETFNCAPKYDYWDFSTNAVTPVSMGIPSIGFGPGEYKLAHMTNENCKVNQIIDACSFYTNLINKL